MKPLDIIFCVMIIASAVLCQRIITHSIANQERKNDNAELNHVRYGLLSINAWKGKITAILAEEIDKLYLSRTNERVLRQQLHVLLNTLIDEIDRKVREKNSGSLGGQITQSLMDAFIDLDELKKGIPEYTDAVIREIRKSETREQIKATLTKQVEHYTIQSFDIQDTSERGRILLKTGAQDIEHAKSTLAAEIAVTKDLIAKEVVLLIILSVIPFAVSGLSNRPLRRIRFLLLILPLLLLLAGGVTTPAIDVEAKISKMIFIVMAHPVQFDNQILYFKSKSILEVFRILVTHRDLQMKFVGVLLITFSIVFPVLKIASSAAHHLDYHHARRNPLIDFFAMKSGKWAMADVMVVAMFMAYIGFNGMITDQLDELKTAGQDLAILTTNGTSLQPGFYLFLTYTLLALFFSGFLTRKPSARTGT